MRKILGKIYFYIKIYFYKKHFKSIGKGISIFGKFHCTGKNIILGENCSINHGAYLGGEGGLVIGNYCRISAGAQIFTGGLDLKHHYINRPHIYNKVNLADGVWLGAGSIILPGVNIGEGSVIAAGAVVSKNVPSFELWGGVPARHIKYIK